MPGPWQNAVIINTHQLSTEIKTLNRAWRDRRKKSLVSTLLEKHAYFVKLLKVSIISATRSCRHCIPPERPAVSLIVHLALSYQSITSLRRCEYNAIGARKTKSTNLIPKPLWPWLSKCLLETLLDFSWCGLNTYTKLQTNIPRQLGKRSSRKWASPGS